MKYLVMECHPGYAIVLDDQGRFLRVANRNYEVGQRVENVLQLQPVEEKRSGSRILRWAAAAACLCLVLFGSWQMLLNPYGSVRIQINPDMNLIVNRLDCVIRVEPINQDAMVFLEGYDPDFQKVDVVADELADRAKQMGYLDQGGQIHVIVASTHEGWKVATQDRLIAQLQVHTGGQITVIPLPKPQPEESRPGDPTEPSEPAAPTEPVKPTEPEPTVPPTEPRPVTMEEAKALAFAHLGITEDQIREPEYEYDEEDHKYELEFILNGVEYSIEVDAATGEILEVDMEDPDELDDDDKDENENYS